jgi:RNA polymerase sigma factor (sigma-70 family)
MLDLLLLRASEEPMSERPAIARTVRAETAELVTRARRGDRQAWDEIVDRHAGTVWAVARAHGLDAHTAADVSQVTWLRLVEHLGSLRDPEWLGAWLATTAKRESLRVLRLRGREVSVEEPEPGDGDDPGAAPDAGLLTAERNAELWRAFASLPDRCQHLLRLLTADPAPSYAEVAAVLGRPIGSIGPTRQRCLDCLRRALAAGDR